jgi:hypothetical protein
MVMRPALIQSSASRREASPARARTFCSRSGSCRSWPLAPRGRPSEAAVRFEGITRLGAGSKPAVFRCTGLVGPRFVRPGPVRPRFVRSVLERPGRVRPGPIRPATVRPGPARPGLVRSVLGRRGPARPGLVRSVLGRPGPVRPRFVRAEPAREGLARFGPESLRAAFRVLFACRGPAFETRPSAAIREPSLSWRGCPRSSRAGLFAPSGRPCRLRLELLLTLRRIAALGASLSISVVRSCDELTRRRSSGGQFVVF